MAKAKKAQTPMDAYAEKCRAYNRAYGTYLKTAAEYNVLRQRVTDESRSAEALRREALAAAAVAGVAFRPTMFGE